MADSVRARFCLRWPLFWVGVVYPEPRREPCRRGQKFAEKKKDYMESVLPRRLAALVKWLDGSACLDRVALRL